MTWLDDLTSETVIVNTSSGDALRGLKSSVYDDCLVLRDARLLQEEGMSATIQGEFVIPRENVTSIQLLPAADGAA
jgi:small nuclear ribonucleoprotein (snRNP)-like protein